MKSGKFKLIITTGITQTFICFAFLWGISVSSSLPQLDFSLDDVQSSSVSGYQSDFIPVGEPQTQVPLTSETQVLPQTPTVPEIESQLQPLLEDYLEDTGRDLNILKPVLDNFTQLITHNLFPLDEVKNVLSQDVTKQLEPALADWFGLTDKLDLTDLNQVKTLVGFSDLCVKGKYTKDGINNILQNLKGKAEIGLEGVRKVASGVSQIDVALTPTSIIGTLTSSISPDNPSLYFGINLLPQYQDLSDMQELSFKLTGIDTWDIEGATLKAVVVRFNDPEGNKIAEVRREGVSDGDTIRVERSEVEEALENAGYKVGSIDIVFEFEVSGRDVEREIKVGNRTIIRKRHVSDALIRSGEFTISDFKIKLPEIKNISDEARRNFLEFILGFMSDSEANELPPIIQKLTHIQITYDLLKLWESLFNPDNLELLKPKIINLILNYINEKENKSLSISDNWFEVFGIVGAIARIAKEKGMKIESKAQLESILKALKTELANSRYPSSEILAILDKFYYPSPVKIWSGIGFWGTKLEVMSEKVHKEKALKKLEEMKSWGINPEDIKLAKLKIILESTLHRKLNLKDCLIDRIIFTYWNNYLNEKNISINQFESLVNTYERGIRLDFEAGNAPQYEGFLPYVPPDMLYGLKKITSWFCNGCVGFCNYEFKIISFYAATKARDVVLAHELTHYKDFWIFSPTPSYLPDSKRYADISNLYYDVYGLLSHPDYKIGDEDESVAYAFGGFAKADLYFGVRDKVQHDILQLMLQYLYGYNSGYGSYFFYDPSKLPLSFKEVREELHANPDLPQFYREALDLTEMIFYNWRRQAGFNDNCDLLKKYDDLSFDELAEKLKQDFPHFYPEAAAFGVDFIRRMNAESSFPEMLQGLAQAEYVLNNSFSSLPAIFDLLKRDIPDMVKIALIGELGKKVKLAFQTYNMLEDIRRYVYGGASHLKNFYLENSEKIITQLIRFSYRHKDELTGKFTFAILYDLSKSELFPQNFRQDMTHLCQIYPGLKQKLDNTEVKPVEIIPRFDPIIEIEDELPVYERPLFFQNQTLEFLSRAEDNKSDDQAREMIFSWWDDLLNKQGFLDALIKNGWEQFLTELNNFILRDSFKVYKHLTGKEVLPAPVQLNLPTIKASNLPFSPGEMKMKLKELSEKGEIILMSFDVRYNNGGSLYGSWNAFPEDYSQYCREKPSYICLGNIGSSLRLDYDVESDNPKGAYNGFWMKMPEKDLSQYQALILFIKGDEITKYPYRFKISLEDKEWQEVEYWPGREEVTVGRGDLYIEGIGNDWKMAIIPLEKFLENGNLKSLTSIDVLSITFEKDVVGQNVGTIYIDEIAFVKDLSLF